MHSYFLLKVLKKAFEFFRLIISSANNVSSVFFHTQLSLPFFNKDSLRASLINLNSSEQTDNKQLMNMHFQVEIGAMIVTMNARKNLQSYSWRSTDSIYKPTQEKSDQRVFLGKIFQQLPGCIEKERTMRRSEK